MEIEGLQLINTTTEQTYSDFGLTIALVISLFLAGSFAIPMIISICFPKIKILILLIIGMISLGFGIVLEYYFNHSDKVYQNTDKNIYEYQVIDKIDLKEIAQNYEIVSYEDNILTLKNIDK